MRISSTLFVVLLLVGCAQGIAGPEIWNRTEDRRGSFTVSRAKLVDGVCLNFGHWSNLTYEAGEESGQAFPSAAQRCSEASGKVVAFISEDGIGVARAINFLRQRQEVMSKQLSLSEPGLSARLRLDVFPHMITEMPDGLIVLHYSHEGFNYELILQKSDFSYVRVEKWQ